MAKNEVAKADAFELITMYAGLDDSARTELEDELSDLGDGGVTYRKIKTPSSGGRAFLVESDNPDDPDIIKELTGVIVFTHLANARFDPNSGNNVPICSSTNAKVGYDTIKGVTVDCDTCPHNSFKECSDGVTRKACKNMRRIYIMLSGKPHLYLLTIPPTSLADVRNQLKKYMASGVPYTSTVLSFTLSATVSRSGKEYAKIVISKVGELTAEQAEQVRRMREQIKASYQAVAITYDDTDSAAAGSRTEEPAPAPATGPDGFMDIPDFAQEELPFN